MTTLALSPKKQERNLILADADIMPSFGMPGYQSIFEYIITCPGSPIHILLIWPFVKEIHRTKTLFEEQLGNYVRPPYQLNSFTRLEEYRSNFISVQENQTTIHTHLITTLEGLDAALQIRDAKHMGPRPSISIPKHVSITPSVIANMFVELTSCPEFGHFYDPTYMYCSRSGKKSSILDLLAFIYYTGRLAASPYYNIADAGLHIICLKAGCMYNPFIPLSITLPGKSPLPLGNIKMKTWLPSMRYEPPINWQFKNWTFTTAEGSTQWVTAHHALGIGKKEFILSSIKWIFILIILCILFYANFSAVSAFYGLVFAIQSLRYMMSYFYRNGNASTVCNSTPYRYAKTLPPEKVWGEFHGNMGPRVMRYAIIIQNYDWAIYSIFSKLFWPLVELLFLYAIFIILFKSNIRTFHKSRMDKHLQSKEVTSNPSKLHYNLQFRDYE